MHGDMTMKYHDDTAIKHDDMAMKRDAADTMAHEQTPRPFGSQAGTRDRSGGASPGCSAAGRSGNPRRWCGWLFDSAPRLSASLMRFPITIANFSPTVLQANADRAGLTPLFDALVSTDANHTYKPDPRAYQLGVDRLELDKREIVFAALGGWDAAGAKSFGYPTVGVNRLNQPIEELDADPDQTVPDLNGLLDFVLKR
jgi:haloacid dehalogenase-like hydrolase